MPEDLRLAEQEQLTKECANLIGRMELDIKYRYIQLVEDTEEEFLGSRR
ncbi:hypothetical protein ACFLW3_00935 [Chloroflexota bacterium]